MPCCALAGLLIGPVKLPALGVLHELAHHLPFLGDRARPLADRRADPRPAAPPARRARPDGRRHARHGRLRLPGRLPQPARRSVPARRRPPARASGRRPRSPSAPTARLGPSTRCRSRRSSARWSPWPRTYMLGRSGRRGRRACWCSPGVTVGAFFTAMQTFVQQHSVQNLQEIYSLHPRRHRDRELARRRARAARTSSSAAIVVLLHRARARRARASATTRPRASASTCAARG